MRGSELVNYTNQMHLPIIKQTIASSLLFKYFRYCRLKEFFSNMNEYRKINIMAWEAKKQHKQRRKRNFRIVKIHIPFHFTTFVLCLFHFHYRFTLTPNWFFRYCKNIFISCKLKTKQARQSWIFCWLCVEWKAIKEI